MNNEIKNYKAKALVVEDNIINQKLLNIMLYNEGISADIANNGKEAIDLFLSNKYDIVFMDMNMPVLDGIDTTKKILLIEKENNYKHIPIIAITAEAIQDKASWISKGLDDFLSKPINIKRFKEILLNYLSHNSGNNEKIENHYDVNAIASTLGINIEILRKLINEFKLSIPDYIHNFENAIKDNDYSNLYKSAHKFKGAAVNLRLKNIAELASEIEINAKNSELIDYHAIFKKINNEMNLISI